MKKASGILILLLLLSSCSHGFDVDVFLEDPCVRLEMPNTSLRSSDRSWQFGYRPETGVFHAVTDDSADYFILTPSSAPVPESGTFEAELRWSTEKGERRKNGLAFEILKREGDLLWLRSGNIYLVVKELY